MGSPGPAPRPMLSPLGVLIGFFAHLFSAPESPKAGECMARLTLYPEPRERVDNKQARGAS